MLMNLIVSTAHAMAGAPGGAEGAPQGSLMTSMLPLVAIFAIFYFLMIRPQQKQQKRVKEMIAALRKGDKVITRGGIHGTIHGITEKIVTLEVADNVRIKLSREAIAAAEATNNQE